MLEIATLEEAGGEAASKQQNDTLGDDEILVFEGRFSWCAAWCMMVWVLVFVIFTVMTVLSFRGTAFELIGTEISFIQGRNPIYGPAEQPLPQREINKPFKFHIPQTALFFSLASSSFGLFTVCYFTSFMLLEDQGTKRVVDIGFLISKGVQVYLERTIPVIGVFLVLSGIYVFVTAGISTLICFSVGSVQSLISARFGVSMVVQGTTRLAHGLTHELFDSLQIGIRTGSISGLLSTSLALASMAAMWLLLGDTLALYGFGSGASIVSFYLRVGGGIFAKGADIGADLIGEMDEHKAEEELKVFQLQKRMAELEDKRKERIRKGLPDDQDDMMDQLRMMEEEMQDIASRLHPIDYLDAVGQNVCDVSGTCADLYESMVIIISTATIIGTKGTEIPHFFGALPFWIAGAGNFASSLVAYYVHVHEKSTTRRIRWNVRANWAIVMVMVQVVIILVCFRAWFEGAITFDRYFRLLLICLMGQLAPELCVMSAEFFTSADYFPVRRIAANSDLGVVQVVLQGIGYGFFSTGFPSLIMIICVVVTWYQGAHVGLALLSCASISATGFQGGIASYGAVANNAHKIVHLTTYHSMTRHRANVCAALGTNCSHAGNVVSAANAFSAVFNLSMGLLAQTYTSMNKNYTAVVGSTLSHSSQAGLVCGVVFCVLFAANTMLSCLNCSKSFMRFCKESQDVQRIDKLPFPQSHVKPLKILTAFGTVTSMRMVFSPVINTLAVPFIGGFFFGTSGLLFILSGANVLVLCLSVFMVNSGQIWGSARKYILFGLLRDSEGEIVGPGSPHYENLGVGESIGGPFEATSGPALNNFVKFFAVMAMVSCGIYEEEPTNFYNGFIALGASITLIIFAQHGLTLVMRFIASILKQRQIQQQFEEGKGDDSESEGAKSE